MSGEMSRGLSPAPSSRLSNRRRSVFSGIPENTLQAVASRRHLLEMLPHPAALFDCETAGMLVEANSFFHDAFSQFHPILALPDFDALFSNSPGLASILSSSGLKDLRVHTPTDAKIFRDTRDRWHLISYRFVRGPVVRNGLLLMAHDVTSMMEQLAAITAPATIQPHTENARIAHLENLTPREREVLHLVVDGKLNKTIADILGISIKTVELHRSRVMHKLGARNVAELVKLTLKAA